MSTHIQNNTFSHHATTSYPYFCNFNEKGLEYHRHIDFYEFSLVASGSYVNSYQGKNYTLSSGQLIFMSPGQVHSFMTDKPNSRHYSFIIHETFFMNYIRKYFDNADEILNTPYVYLELENSAFIYLLHLASLCSRSISSEQNSIYGHLLYNMVFNCFTKLPDVAENSISVYAIDLLRRLDAYHLNNANISEIYKEYPISTTTLIRDFSKLTGCTIVQYKAKKRMEYAANLLAEENYSISSIADMLNISGLGYFSKQFREQYGMTPKQWQISHRKQKKNLSFESKSENISEHKT